jgi:hypothetical protein
MFNLKVDRELQGASIWVRWCLDPETREVLKKHAGENPQLLLIITGGSIYKETRKIVDLEDVVQILPLRYPGKNTILSAIIWGNVHTREEIFLHRHDNVYGTDLVNYPGYKKNGAPILSGAYESYKLSGPVIEVDVPQEIFAKEPPEWEKTWVNRWHYDPPRDQCKYRARRIFAYTLQPFLFLIPFCVTGAIFLVFAFFALLFGFYKPSIDERLDTSANLFKVIKISGWSEDNWWCKIWRALFPENEERARRRQYKKEEQERQKEKAEAAARVRIYESLSCDSGTKPTPPLKHQLYLMFHDVKAKVCKPFAG